MEVQMPQMPEMMSKLKMTSMVVKIEIQITPMKMMLSKLWWRFRCHR